MLDWVCNSKKACWAAVDSGEHYGLALASEGVCHIGQLAKIDSEFIKEFAIADGMKASISQGPI
ncbi:MAG: hypothetical protein J7M40_08685 [Planctomycetes bacterium]|nr:hypothetical protein [Planctomycetota bacterium]